MALEIVLDQGEPLGSGGHNALANGLLNEIDNVSASLKVFVNEKKIAFLSYII